MLFHSMTKKSFAFPRSKRLRLRNEIGALFSGGKQFSVFPVKAIYTVHKGNGQGLKLAVSVPKRNFKRAADRNRIKRQMREAFRLNSPKTSETVASRDLTVNVMLVFNGKELPDYAGLAAKIILILQRLKQVHEERVD
jgi:ribonuclease P protein component